MPSFNVIEEYGFSDPDVISVSPSWVLAVVRLQYPFTYSRKQKESFSREFSKAVETRGPPLILQDSCISLSVTNTKRNHITQMEATLLPGEVNYLAEILPGDYVFAWMANNKQTIDDVIERIKNREHCNRFQDGLKFIGRVQAVRKRMVVDPGSGNKIVRYSISSYGFVEFDASVFYEPHLAQKVNAIGEYYAKIGAKVNELVEKNGKGIGVGEAMITFLDLLLGKGVPPNFGMGTDVPAELRSTAGLEGKHSYIVPDTVGQLLKKTIRTSPGGLLVYADLLEVIYGVQSYAQSAIASEAASAAEETQTQQHLVLASMNMSPDNTRQAASRRFTGTPMLGTFTVKIPQFTGKTVWNILNEFLNPAVNEMYSCLRANAEGLVVPTLIIRQLPFSSPLANTSAPVTKFQDLPRWNIDPRMVKSFDLGRSDTLRFNFVHVYGNVDGAKADTYSKQIVRYPPHRDDLDIARSGLRLYQMTIPCHPTDYQKEGPKQWMEILADIMMGQHLTVTGTMETVGIQSPVCPGDNVEFDGVLFHIESVMHTCSINNGTAQFTTTMALSHGVSSEIPVDDLSVYIGIDSNDQRTYEPGLTHEIRDQNEASVTRGNNEESEDSGG